MAIYRTTQKARKKVPEPTCKSCNQPFITHPRVQELCRRNALLMEACERTERWLALELEDQLDMPVWGRNLKLIRAAIAESTPH